MQILFCTIFRYILTFYLQSNRFSTKFNFILPAKVSCIFLLKVNDSSQGIENFKVTVIGKGKINDIPEKIRKYFDIKGRLPFNKMYQEIEKADFILDYTSSNNIVMYDGKKHGINLNIIKKSLLQSCNRLFIIYDIIDIE